MGSCVSKRQIAIYPQHSPGIRQHDIVTTSNLTRAAIPIEPEDLEDVGDLRIRKSLCHVVDPTIPESFYPNVIRISHEEEQCTLTRRKITVKETERELRCSVEEVLKNWRGGSILGEIESHALSVPAEHATSIETLALGLTHPQAKYSKSLCDSGPFHLLLAKAYAIYFWIANNIHFCKNMWKTFLSNSEGLKLKTEPQEVLQKRKCLSIGHANLFHSVATAAGLTSHVVVGNLKLCRSLSSQDYKQDFEPSRLNMHWWNVFLIDGVWFPVDCASGAGMLAPHLSFQPKFTPHYFAVSPDSLICSHIPVEPEWQLLHEPVSHDNLRPMISPSLLSFHLGIQPLSWAEMINIDHDSNTTTFKIQFRAPPNLQLTAKLRREGDYVNRQDETSLLQDDQSQLQTTYIKRDSNEVDIYAAVPGKGVYFLDIYTHQNHESLMFSSYMVNCSTKPKFCIGFPTVYELPSVAFKFKLLYWNTPETANICENNQGRMDLTFQCLPAVQFHHYLISGKNISRLEVLDAHYYCTTITHDPNDHSLHKLSVIFPTKGWWTLCLCAAKKTEDIEVSGFTALLNFPIFAKKELQRCSYPHIQSSDIRFESSEPLSCSGTGILVVTFFSVKKLRLYSCLCYESLEDKQETQYTLTQCLEGLTALNESRYSLQVVFPKPGQWYVRVFACAVEEPPGTKYITLFNLLLDVSGCMENAVFPLMEQEVTEKCSIRLLPNKTLIMLSEKHDMFSFKFQAPNVSQIIFDHYIEPRTESNAGNPVESLFHRYCTFLGVSEVHSTHCIYELKAAFPSKGKWNVMVCAGESLLAKPKVAIRVSVDVTKTLHVQSRVFPRIHQALSEFGITFSEQYPLYQKSIDGPEFEFEFSSPRAINYAWCLQDILNQKQFQHSTNVYLEASRSGDNVMQKLRVIFPKPGVWLVQVVARTILTNIVADSSLSVSLHYQPVFDLIIDSSNASLSHMAFPRVYESLHSKFGLHTNSTDIPVLSHINQLPATCTIKFYSQPGVVFWHYCKEFSQLEDKKITRMISNPDTGLHELCVDINECGQWTVYLHAKFSTDTTNNWIAVLQHTITTISSNSHSFCSLSTH